MTALTKALAVLESAIGYGLASTAMVTPHLLSRPTPCADWDLAMLLDHVADSAQVLDEAISAGRVDAHVVPAGSDPILRLRGRLDALLASATAARPPDRPVAILDRELTASMVAVTGAIELAVHGWDIASACGSDRPVPPGLADVLLVSARSLVSARTRPGLFADPVALPGPASVSDEFIAFLGRNPFRAAIPRRPPGLHR